MMFFFEISYMNLSFCGSAKSLFSSRMLDHNSVWFSVATWKHPAFPFLLISLGMPIFILFLQELLAIQQEGPRAIGFFGTRNMGFLHQELIEILSYAMVITVWHWNFSLVYFICNIMCSSGRPDVFSVLDLTTFMLAAWASICSWFSRSLLYRNFFLQENHIYTSGASGTNAAVIRGALRAEKPELLTVILPQSLKKQPPESQELLSKVRFAHDFLLFHFSFIEN